MLYICCIYIADMLQICCRYIADMSQRCCRYHADIRCIAKMSITKNYFKRGSKPKGRKNLSTEKIKQYFTQIIAVMRNSWTTKFWFEMESKRNQNQIDHKYTKITRVFDHMPLVASTGIFNSTENFLRACSWRFTERPLMTTTQNNHLV